MSLTKRAKKLRRVSFDSSFLSILCVYSLSTVRLWRVYKKISAESFLFPSIFGGEVTHMWKEEAKRTDHVEVCLPV